MAMELNDLIAARANACWKAIIEVAKFKNITSFVKEKKLKGRHQAALYGGKRGETLIPMDVVIDVAKVLNRSPKDLFVEQTAEELERANGTADVHEPTTKKRGKAVRPGLKALQDERKILMKERSELLRKKMKEAKIKAPSDLHEKLLGAGKNTWTGTDVRQYVKGQKFANEDFLEDVVPILNSTLPVPCTRAELKIRDFSFEHWGRHASIVRANAASQAPQGSAESHASANGRLSSTAAPTPVAAPTPSAAASTGSRLVSIKILLPGRELETMASIVKIGDIRRLVITDPNVDLTAEEVLKLLDL